MIKYHFELRAEGKVIDAFISTFTECRQRGDEQATNLVDTGLADGLQCRCYNDALHRWENLGKFLGHKRYTDAFGKDRVIRDDYRGLEHIKEGGAE